MASRYLSLDRPVSINTVEIREFFLLFTVATFFTNSRMFFDRFYFLSVTKTSLALGIPGILTQGAVRLATDNMPLANPCSVVLIALFYFSLGVTAKRMCSVIFPERTFTVCFSYCTSSLLMLLYPLQYLRCCITFICSLHSQTRRLMPNPNILQMQKLFNKQKNKRFLLIKTGC